ncbi:MAG: hypothetical protein ACLP81_00735 [Acidimicrobiales bacterium]
MPGRARPAKMFPVTLLAHVVATMAPAAGDRSPRSRRPAGSRR